TTAKAAAQGGVLRLGYWHHLVGTYDAQTVRLYVDGALVSGTSFGSGMNSPATALLIGASGGACLGSAFNGQIDEVRFLNYAAGAEQIARDYAAGQPFVVETSTDAGKTWRQVISTYSLSDQPFLSLSGAAGAFTPETLQVADLTLANSTSTQTGNRGTNELKLTVFNLAGTSTTAGPFAVIIDTVAAIAKPGPIDPPSGAPVTAANPSFAWTLPSSVNPNDIQSYTLSVSSYSNFIASMVASGIASSPHVWAGPALLPQAQYWWRVTSKSRAGVSSSLSGPLRVPLTSGLVSASGLTTAGFPNGVVNNVLAENTWNTDSAVPGAYLGLDFGFGVQKSLVRWRVSSNGANHAGNFIVQWSDDNAAWTDASARMLPRLLGWNDVGWADAGPHRYWRLLLNNTPGAGPWFDDIEVYEADSAPADATFQYVGPGILPTASSFVSFNSSGDPVVENSFNDLSMGVTVQVTVQDSILGLGWTSIGPIAGTVGFWRLDEGAGSVARDASAGHKDGLLVNGATWLTGSTCRRGACAQFAGAGSQRLHLPVPSLGVIDQPWTISLWARPTATRGVLVHLNDGAWCKPMLGFDAPGNRLIAESYNGGSVPAASNSALPPGVWSHVAMTWSAVNGLRLFVNGQLVASGSIGSFAASGGSPYLWVGAAGAPSCPTALIDTTRDFAGQVDDVKVRDYEATQAQVNDERNAGVGFFVEVSTNAGNTWRPVVASSAPAPYVTLSGAPGSLGVETLKAVGLNLSFSTSSATGGQATNQIRFHIANTAGNVRTAGPFAVIVDTVVAKAIPEASLPLDGSDVATVNPILNWILPFGNYSDIIQYRVEFSEEDDFTPLVGSTEPVAFTFAVPISMGLQNGRTYYWHVRSRNKLGQWSVYGASASFHVDTDVPQPNAFRSLGTGGAEIPETGYNDLADGVTAQLVLQDAGSGLSNTYTLGALPGTLRLYHFDTGSGGTATDFSGFDRHATMNGGSPWAPPGIMGYGSSLRGDGTATYADAGFAGFGGVSSMTFEAWIRTPNSFGSPPNNRRCIVCKQDAGATDRDFAFYVYSGDGGRVTGFQFFSTIFGNHPLSGTAINLPRSYAPNTWHHVAWTIDTSGFFQVFSDGVLIYSGTNLTGT
ncbi:MAG: laminin G domain-containing protein, partial [Elusimicrobia bacterium]|nr:laminin G domain-containing protein [Elusimicrobiota bacterium]